MKKSFVTLGAQLKKLNICNMLCMLMAIGLPALAGVAFVGKDMLCKLP